MRKPLGNTLAVTALYSAAAGNHFSPALSDNVDGFNGRLHNSFPQFVLKMNRALALAALYLGGRRVSLRASGWLIPFGFVLRGLNVARCRGTEIASSRWGGRRTDRRCDGRPISILLVTYAIRTSPISPSFFLVW